MITKRPFVSITVKDGSNSYSRMRLSTKIGLEADYMLEGVEAFLLPLHGVTGCVTTRISATYGFSREDAPAPITGSNSSIVAVFIFETTIAGQYAMIEVPGIKDECILNDGSVNSGLVIDSSHPSIIALVEAVTSNLPCNRFGYDIVSLAATIVERRI